MKAEDARYTSSLENILKDEETSNKEIYNINKAIELRIINKDDTYGMFLTRVAGFKNTKQFIKFCENAFELMNQE